MEMVSGCEAKNKYAVHQLATGPDGKASGGQQTMYIREESECCETLPACSDGFQSYVAETNRDADSAKEYCPEYKPHLNAV